MYVGLQDLDTYISGITFQISCAEGGEWNVWWFSWFHHLKTIVYTSKKKARRTVSWSLCIVGGYSFGISWHGEIHSSKLGYDNWKIKMCFCLGSNQGESSCQKFLWQITVPLKCKELLGKSEVIQIPGPNAIFVLCVLALSLQKSHAKVWNHLALSNLWWSISRMLNVHDEL